MLCSAQLLFSLFFIRSRLFSKMWWGLSWTWLINITFLFIFPILFPGMKYKIQGGLLGVLNARPPSHYHGEIYVKWEEFCETFDLSWWYSGAAGCLIATRLLRCEGKTLWVLLISIVFSRHSRFSAQWISSHHPDLLLIKSTKSIGPVPISYLWKAC